MWAAPTFAFLLGEDGYLFPGGQKLPSLAAPSLPLVQVRLVAQGKG